MAVRAALDGVGLHYTSWNYVKDKIADEQLVQLFEGWLPQDSDGFFLYYPSRRQVPTPLQVLVSFLRENLKNGKNGSR